MNSVVVYSTALCNLNCRYCFISKNESLHVVDQQLEECFNDENYFLNLLEEYVSEDEIKDIELLEVWGGEPLLHIDRIFGFIEQLVQKSSKFQRVFISSNFSHEKVVPSIQSLQKFLNKFTDRKFSINLQLSCDGPVEITDAGRGIGTTSKIISTFHEFITSSFLKESSNVRFTLHIKPTLDIKSLALLNDYDFNIYYYKFFEDNFYQQMKDNNLLSICTLYSTPNLASPYTYTQEDGLLLSSITKLQRLIEDDNKQKNYFDYYKDITLYSHRAKKDKDYDGFTFCSNNTFCGSGCNTIGLLPNHSVCGCHRSFGEYYVPYIENYVRGLNNQSTLTTSNDYASLNHLIFSSKEEWDKYSSLMKSYSPQNFKEKSTTFIYSNACELMSLANCGLVDPMYKNLEEAIRGVKQVMICSGACVANNLLLTQVTTCYPTYQLKFFCNGALSNIFK